jgi:AraC-like DNA-binding protein
VIWRIQCGLRWIAKQPDLSSVTFALANLLQIALIAIASLGVVLTIHAPRLRALSAVMGLAAVWMVFNLLEETAGFREIWLVTPAFRLAYPALFYLMVRALIRSGPALRWRDAPHALPFIIALALTPYISWVEHGARLSFAVYGGLSVWLVHRFHLVIGETRSDAQLIGLNWLYAIIGVYIVDGVMDIVRMDAVWLHDDWPWLQTQGAYVAQLVVSLSILVAMIVLTVHRRSIFDGLDADALTVDPALEPAIDITTEFARLDALVRDEALYTEPRLSRVEVASATGLPERAVSHAIKLATGRNFNEYINAMRIEDVCAMMQADAEGGVSRTMLDLAYTAGFSSKSVFNDVFKRETGTTPSAFMAALKTGP